MLNPTVDDLNRLVLAIVAVVSVFFGPLMQWRIARRQAEIQSSIAARQIADNISSKRQAWIDGLRADAAEFLTATGRSQEFRREFVWKLDPKEAFRGLLESDMRAKELALRIQLRLNPSEADHIKLTELIFVLASKTMASDRKSR